MKLAAQNIKKSYKGRQVVKGVSVEVNQGEIVGLLGPNGAGKTTSFYMIVGLVRPNSGKVFLDDKEITRHAMYKRAQLGIGYLPQEVSVFRKMTVEDNIMTVLEMTKMGKEERYAKLESLLEEFGLNHVRKNLGQSLSGGEKRRTEIARALATDPKFILLDEPFAGVDPIAVEDIQRIVYQLKKKNIGVLITDHNVQETLSITDRTYLLFEGNILREGTAETLAADEMVRKVYLGSNFELRKKDYESLDEKPVGGFGGDYEESKGIEYIKSVLDSLDRIKDQLNNSFLSIEGLDRTDDLKRQLVDLKEFFQLAPLNPRAGQILKKLSFGPTSRYKSRMNLLFYILIPVVGWALLWNARNNQKKCIEDLGILRSDLERLRNAIENPELFKQEQAK